MNAYWEKLSAKVDALNRRERLLVLLGVIALVWLLMNSMLLAPLSQHKKILNDQLISDRAQRVSMQQQLQLLAGTPPVDADVANRSRLEALRNQLQHTNASLDAMQKELVSPDKMAGLLEDILKKNDQLKLISLKTLPAGEAEALNTAESSAASTAPVSATGKAVAPIAGKLSVYRHGVELKVQGRYLDLLNYLRTLEKLPWHMLWGNVRLTANAYPQSTLTVTIYTLSLDQAWLSI